MKISIKNNDNSVQINDLGFVTHWSSNPLVRESHPIYLVLFEEYSRINPFCQPLDMTHNIEIKISTASRVLYSKKIDNFLFEHEICSLKDGINWSIRLDPLCTNHSIGMAMPFFENWSDFSSRPIKEEIANYSSFFHANLYPDQYVLDIPCVSSNDMIVFGDNKNAYQFFRYQDDDSRWLRMTTSTSNITEETVQFCIRTKANSIPELYLEQFPEADEFVHTWKSSFKELGQRFGIDILYQQSETTMIKGNVTYVSQIAPTVSDIERYYPVLQKELEKYSESVFADLNITCIQLVADLWIQTDRIQGKVDSRRLPGYFADGILWTEGENKGLIINLNTPIRILHHEIFHGIQQNQSFHDMPGSIHQFSDTIQINDPNEYLAELFALLMTNPGKAYDPKLGITSEQIDYLKNGVKKHVTFPDVANMEHRTIFAVTPNGVQEIEFGDAVAEATHYIFDKDAACRLS